MQTAVILLSEGMLMSEEQLWEQFQNSGSITDYLQLTAVRRQKEETEFADSEGCCTDAETNRRTGLLC